MVSIVSQSSVCLACSSSGRVLFRQLSRHSDRDGHFFLVMSRSCPSAVCMLLGNENKEENTDA